MLVQVASVVLSKRSHYLERQFSQPWIAGFVEFPPVRQLSLQPTRWHLALQVGNYESPNAISRHAGS
jgi:hypothetical protein